MQVTQGFMLYIVILLIIVKSSHIIIMFVNYWVIAHWIVNTAAYTIEENNQVYKINYEEGNNNLIN